MTWFGIYMKRYDKSILLMDGAFMSEDCCDDLWHKPRLFATHNGARNYLHKSGRIRKHYIIRKYRGGTE